MEKTVYKIIDASQWREAQADHVFNGTAADIADGFIHLSAKYQVDETLARHFNGQENLLLLAIDAGRLGERLKWEPSRGGETFPHLYGPMSTRDVLSVTPIERGNDGLHVVSFS